MVVAAKVLYKSIFTTFQEKQKKKNPTKTLNILSILVTYTKYILRLIR